MLHMQVCLRVILHNKIEMSYYNKCLSDKLFFLLRFLDSFFSKLIFGFFFFLDIDVDCQQRQVNRTI